MRRTRLVLSTLLASAVLLAPAVVEAAAPPIPPLPTDLLSESFTGTPATKRPVAHSAIPQHPYLSPNGTNSMHDDAYASDAYEVSGPLGRKLQVRSATYGVSECATMGFDAKKPDRRPVRRSPGIHDAADRPDHARGDHLAGHARPRPHLGQQPAERPVRRRVLLPRQVEPRLRADHDERDLAGHHHRDRVEAHGDLLARDPRGRLHDRHDARLEEPDLLRHQGRPDRHRRRLDRGLADQVLPRRGDLQLDGGRRDRRRLCGDRPPRCSPWWPTSPATRRCAGRRRTTAAPGTKPGQLSQGSGTTPTLHGQGHRRDHRQRRAADERAVLQAQRRRRRTG